VQYYCGGIEDSTDSKSVVHYLHNQHIYSYDYGVDQNQSRALDIEHIEEIGWISDQIRSWFRSE
jgi:hypothetical protein